MIRSEVKLTWNGNDVIIKAHDWGKKSPYEAGIILMAEAASLVPQDNGQLRNSISVQTIEKTKSIGSVTSQNILPKPTENDVALVGTNLKYAAATEYGSRPHMPPVDALKTWAKRHLGSEDAAWPLALSIKKKGTKAQPFMRPAFDLTFNRMLTAFTIVGKQEFKEYFKEIV